LHTTSFNVTVINFIFLRGAVDVKLSSLSLKQSLTQEILLRRSRWKNFFHPPPHYSRGVTGVWRVLGLPWCSTKRMASDVIEAQWLLNPDRLKYCLFQSSLKTLQRTAYSYQRNDRLFLRKNIASLFEKAGEKSSRNKSTMRNREIANFLVHQLHMNL